jgi:hypothetical protein
MPDPHDPREKARQSAAWQAAQQWRERARRTRPGGPLGGLKLVLAWLLFGTLMVVAMALGLVFLLIGWAMLPLLRYRMKKRMAQMRAEQAEHVGGETPYREAHYRETRYWQSRSPGGGSREQRVLEGDYEVKAQQAPRDEDSASR